MSFIRIALAITLLHVQAASSSESLSESEKSEYEIIEETQNLRPACIEVYSAGTKDIGADVLHQSCEDWARGIYLPTSEAPNKHAWPDWQVSFLASIGKSGSFYFSHGLDLTVCVTKFTNLPIFLQKLVLPLRSGSTSTGTTA